MFLLLLLLAGTDAFMYPRDCFAKKTDVCCPNYMDSPCGAAFNRGSCMPVRRSRSDPPPPPNVIMDDRFGHPLNRFNYTCVCKPNFWGAHCGYCKFGYEGDSCNIKSPVQMRRELRELNRTEVERFLSQLNYCKYKQDPMYVMQMTGDRYRYEAFHYRNGSYYDMWCYMHYMATKPFMNNTVERIIIDFAHGSSGFFTWHRLFLLLFELMMRLCLGDPYYITLYYDWGREGGVCRVCTDDYMGDNDIQGYISKAHIFSSWRTVCSGFDFPGMYCPMSECECERTKIMRKPGGTPRTFIPSGDDIQFCLDNGQFDAPPYNSRSNSTRNCIEGNINRLNNQVPNMHNMVHLYCGGIMAQTPVSCNDPLFIAHHAFVDKMFARQMTYRGWGPSNYPSDNPYYGHRIYDCIGPFYDCFRHTDMMVDTTALGYGYTGYGNF